MAFTKHRRSVINKQSFEDFNGTWHEISPLPGTGRLIATPGPSRMHCR